MTKSVLPIQRASIFIALALILASGYWYIEIRSDKDAYQLQAVRVGDFLQQVSVSGKVIASEEADLGFTLGGKIARIAVRVGQKVSKGTLLVEAENNDLIAQYLQKKAALDVERARLASVSLGTRPEQLSITRSEVERDEQSLAQANQAVVDAIKSAYATSDDAIRNKFDQLLSNPRTNPQLIFSTSNGELELAVESGRLIIEANLVAWQKTIDSLSIGSNMDGAIAETQLYLDKFQVFLTTGNTLLNTAVSNQTVSAATINSYIENISLARTNINADIVALTTSVTVRKKALSELETSKRSLLLEEAGSVQADIDAQRARVNVADADVKNAEALLEKTRIHAPFTGIVTKIPIRVGEIVASNTIVASLIGEGSLQIESFVPEINVALISINDEAQVTLDAYGSSVPFQASIVAIDPAETIKDGVPTYKTTIAFVGKDDRVKVGMTANVRITTDKRGGVIQVPQGLVEERDGVRYVKILETGIIQEREVVTGALSSDGAYEIIKGLSEGETLVISP